KAADLVLHLVDGSNPVETGYFSLDVETLWVGTKQDLWLGTGGGSEFDAALSTVTGNGVSELIERLGQHALAALGNAGDVLPSRQRHVSLLVECLTCLQFASSAVDLPVELRCEELRAASDRLGMIVGATHVEDLLDVIFSQFCIGK
ncbi:MAG: tRNA uridine-5-carboxymethylaminomethyl(34) synthesis GTPase MnmE, partial [Pseudaminobacter sp.]|nr:tRNA uridine-5-carboxymethylaminomethyl(34) synthesis GTPase MnmE [Pseudaminobacter sp.]